MDFDAAVSKSQLLDRCRTEQRSGIYLAGDGRRVYFFGGIFGRGCLVEDMASFELLQNYHQKVRRFVFRTFLFINVMPFLFAALFPQSRNWWGDGWFRSASAIILATGPIVGASTVFPHVRFLYRRFPSPPDSPSWKNRLAQRRALADGELPMPLRARETSARHSLGRVE